MDKNDIFQVVYLVIGFVFGILTSVIKLNFEDKKQKFNLIKEWLSDIEEEFRINVEYQLDRPRAGFLWGEELIKNVNIKLLRSNARMFGLTRSKATPKKIRHAIEIVNNQRAQGQNILNAIRMSDAEGNKKNQDQKDKLDIHLSVLTESICNANRIIAEHEKNPFSMLFL
jgi:hypothetical protein